MSTRSLWIMGLVMGLGGLACEGRHDGPVATAAAEPDPTESAPAPTAPEMPAAPPIQAAREQLGRMLFFEARLSKPQTISCNSCHDLQHYGVDGRRTALGFKGRQGRRNAPSVYNAASKFRQFWDGRSPNVEAQALGPIVSPAEMASTPQRVLATLRSMPEYVERFGQAFPGDPNPVSFANVGRAIGAFERRLVTTSRWDRFLKGERDALTAAEKQGMKVFYGVGCALCHFGPQVGAASFQKVGRIQAWPNQADQGRFELTGSEEDRMVFQVPSLRNVTHTAPYFHDGSAATLDEAIRMMGRYQLGTELATGDVAAIKVFLESLSGELPKDLIARPHLPASTAGTPGPEQE